MATASLSAAQQPDFSGIWAIDLDRSSDAVKAVKSGLGENLARGKKQMLQRYLADVLVRLAHDADAVEINHSAKDIVIFDKADNINIYYIDGKKHVRQDQDLGDIETVTEWNGNELVIRSKGKEAGQGVQTFSMKGSQLLVSIVVKAKHFPNDIVANFYYDRVE